MFCVVNADMDRITFTGFRLKFLSWSTVTYSYLSEKGQRINLLMSAILWISLRHWLRNFWNILVIAAVAANNWWKIQSSAQKILIWKIFKAKIILRICLSNYLLACSLLLFSSSLFEKFSELTNLLKNLLQIGMLLVINRKKVPIFSHRHR